MEKIILGLLLFNKKTIYEIRTFVKQNLKSICSDSVGSIQVAIKKLIEKDCIGFEEYVENSVNKKKYFIKEKGRIELNNWLEKPMSVGKSKNMELGKLFFMGILPKEKCLSLVNEYLQSLKEEKAYFDSIKEYIENNDLYVKEKDLQPEIKEYILANLKDTKNEIELNESMEQAVEYYKITLDYGIKYNLFEIEFYENLKRKLEQNK